ncbi:MAG: iron chelate uptake ABC transporter family permease subunit, partial [Pseudomonadota bacterium]
MTATATSRIVTATLALAVVALMVASLLTGPAQFAPAMAIKALVSDQGVVSIIVRDIRLPRTLLAALIGATFGLAGASLQGLLRNPLAEPSLFGAPQAAAAAAAAIMAFGFATALSIAVPLGGIAGALLSVGALVAIAGRRASLTVTLLAGLALASLAGAA